VSRARNRGARWARAGCVCAALGAATLAQAQPADPQRFAAAQTLFNKGVEALDAKKYDVACPMLAEAVSLEPDAIGARFVLAECYEHQGKLASAWSTYLQAQSQAEKVGRADRAAEAKKKAAALQPRLAMLTLVVPDAVRALPGLVIRRDGIEVGPAQWGTALPVDKGSHAVVVAAGGRTARESGVVVTEDGASVSFEVQMPLATAPVPSASAMATAMVTGAVPSPTASAAVTSPPRGSETPGSPLRTAGFVLGAVGIAALGGGAAAGAVAFGKEGASEGCAFDAKLGKDVCTSQAAVDARNAAVAAASWSTGLFIAGGAAAAVGIAFVLLGGNSPSQKPAPPRVSLHVGPSFLGVTGRW
jgi:hypothetical protein